MELHPYFIANHQTFAAPWLPQCKRVAGISRVLKNGQSLIVSKNVIFCWWFSIAKKGSNGPGSDRNFDPSNRLSKGWHLGGLSLCIVKVGRHRNHGRAHVSWAPKRATWCNEAQRGRAKGSCYNIVIDMGGSLGGSNLQKLELEKVWKVDVCFFGPATELDFLL